MDLFAGLTGAQDEVVAGHDFEDFEADGGGEGVVDVGGVPEEASFFCEFCDFVTRDYGTEG